MRSARLLSLLAASWCLSSSALAVCPVGSVDLPAGVDPATLVWAVEGPLAAYDVAAGSLTVFGTTFLVPPAMLISTSTIGGPGDITFTQLTSPAPGYPLPTGGTVTASGSFLVSGACGQLVPDAVYFEFGEHVVVGPLVSVDAAAGSFNVAGTTVFMNTDPRIPADILDLNFDPIASVADLAGWEGSIVTVEGYFRDGTLWGKVVETEIVPPSTTDSVAIERADWRQSKSFVEVRGVLFPLPGQAPAATVNIDVGCNGTIDNVGSTAPGALLGTVDWAWRSGNNSFRTNPGSVCVTSPNGGTATRTFTVR
jgi:hypothetical protein